MTCPETQSPRAPCEPGDILPTGRKAWSLGDAFRIAGLIAASGGIILVHYLTPAVPQYAIVHDIHRQILYIPIILAAFWFGWRGGLICATAIIATYFPHVHHGWGGAFFDANLNRTLEFAMYLAVGGITGYLCDRLRKANAQLSGKSRQLGEAMRDLTNKTREVFEAEEQLRQADRLKALGQLTTGLAHEIRNPLASIRGAAEILADSETEPGQRAEFSHVLIEETERLDGVLKNFLDYARTQKNGGGAAELKPVVDRLLILLDTKMRSATIRMDVDLPPALPSLAISEDLLQQVLMNILLNAVQAMADGVEQRIEAGDAAGKGKVFIAVADTGPGVAPDLVGRIFEPFFTTKPAGTGLGLSIVRKIVASHRGRVYVDAQYARGTRVVIELPKA
ncbi:MAG: ATP-binding protein [bacterium]|nr:ATP-binding protein [bacterium]